MSKINLLDSSIYNKISAGEVVERPSSVVKELVENCIDAGADSIIVEIIDGGLRSIQVTDNGEGMDEDNIDLAFLPHATSKIKDSFDLFKISTMGFRGEALASISAISMIEIKSKIKGNDVGSMLNLKAGIIIDKAPCSCAQGTSVKVENLFFNTPARLKFMKRPKTEENYIKTVINNLILANPNISITLIADNKRIISSQGKGLINAIKSIWDNEIVSNLIELSYSKGNYRINGYIGKPTFSKSNRSYQTVIINGRVVNCQIISTAVQKAYGNSMMTRCFPIFVLDVVAPFDTVDVNVHPAKAEVRFRDNNIIFGIVYSAILRTLNDNCNNIPDIKNTDFYEKSDPSNSTIIKKPVNNISYTQPITPNTNKFADIVTSNRRQIAEKDSVTGRILDNIKEQITLDNMADSEQIEENNKDYKIIGQLFNTYLILEYSGYALIIDQHASMEAIRYKMLVEQVEQGKILKQSLLLPYILKVNHFEDDFVQKNFEVFNSLGIEIESFGNNSYRINTVPAVLNNINLDEFFKSVMSEIINSNIPKLSDLLRDKLAQKACKASIKGGDKLNHEQIKILLSNIKDDKIPLQCPHGRPAVIRLKNSELEKWFKRII